MEHAVHALLPVIILLAAGIIGAALVKSIGLTPILGFFLAGVIIGPSALNLVPQSDLLTLLAEIGVVLLLFDIGLHLSFRQMWRLRAELFVLGPLQVAVSGVLIAAVTLLFDFSWQTMLVIGAGLALSSTAIVMQLLNERSLMQTELGQSATSILIFQDILIVFLLVLIPAIAAEGEVSVASVMGLALLKAAAALLCVYLVGKFVLKPLLARIIQFASEELFTASVLLIIISTAAFTGYAGLSLALGAFLAGLVISETTFCYMVKAEIAPFRTLLLGLFFISVGMTLDLSTLAEHWLTIGAAVIVFMLLKVLALCVIGLVKGQTFKQSLALSLWLSQAGEFGFVLFALAFDQGLLSDAIYQLLIVSIGVSFLLTPLMIRLANRLQTETTPASADQQQDQPHGSQKVIIFGMNHAGRNIARLLTAAQKPYLGIDPHSEHVKKSNEEGLHVAHGEPDSQALLHSLELDQAELVVFAHQHDGRLPELITQLKEQYPDVAVFANVDSNKPLEGMQQTPTCQTIYDPHHHGLKLGGAVLKHLGVEAERAKNLVDEFSEPATANAT